VEKCPKCAKTTAHRLISAGTNFILKGGGWYSDLYASPKAEKSEKPPEKADKPAEGGTSQSGASPEPAGKAPARPASSENPSTSSSPSPSSTTPPSSASSS
jgi:hypothetical protein